MTPAHLAAAGVAADTPFVGTENGEEFFRVLILGEKQDMDVALAARDILEAGRTLMRRHPDVGAIVLECTNMPPYAHALREALGVPVFDIYSLITWLHAGYGRGILGRRLDRARPASGQLFPDLSGNAAANTAPDRSPAQAADDVGHQPAR